MSHESSNGKKPMPLGKALAEIKSRYPWVSEGALKKRIRGGEIPSERSSNSKRARYFVKLSDLEAAVQQQQQQP